ncbi:hypothetical protein PN462_21095 [Spirulina sp. CS-785/01]|uniref:hypothetical protein n=1 Tax=Spirulina sp. CS-785/01 TaxID=3021716 RepID=UPI00232D7E4E|nr:hypothetical protein [Spirulina sp. CS-785/01]MDB9315623.1 hypothetical protein [Spirulina sp. CS-785/01]
MSSVLILYESSQTAILFPKTPQSQRTVEGNFQTEKVSQLGGYRPKIVVFFGKLTMTYVKQWVEVGGVPYPEYGCLEVHLPEDETPDEPNDLLDKSFDELTPEELQTLRNSYLNQDDEF